MNPQFSDPGLLTPSLNLAFPPRRPPHSGEAAPFPSSDARPLPDALPQCPGLGPSTPPLSAPSTSVSSWPSSGRAGLMNVGLWLQARPRPALQSPAQGFCWPLCPSATRAQGRGVFGSGLNLLVHVRAFPPRLRACACNMCDQHTARSSSFPDSQTPPFGPPFLRWAWGEGEAFLAGALERRREGKGERKLQT